jgi:exoribonuclease-2
MYRACWDDTIHFPARRIPSSPTLRRRSNSSCIKRFAKPSANASHGRRGVRQGHLGRVHPSACRIGAQGTWIELLKEYALHDTEAPRYRLARDLLNRAEVTADAPFRLLVRLGVWDEDENLLLLRLGVPTSFSPEVLQEAAHAAREVTEREVGRLISAGI